MDKPKIVRFDFGSVYETQNSSQDENKKIDEIKLWDAYWEQQLIKNGVCQVTSTKLRVLPHQKKVNLILVFCFKHDNNEYDKKKAQFTLKIEIPDSLYGKKEFTITGEKLLNSDFFDQKKKDGKTYYYCEIANFTSDFKYSKLPQPFKEK